MLPAFSACDLRGEFVKPFTISSQVYKDLDFRVAEYFYSVNRKNVFRGFHFQLPPHDHEKIVFVIQGAILDVVIDLHKSRKIYGVPQVFQMQDTERNALYIPKGYAHGFLTLCDNTIVGYLQSSPQVREAESGLHWQSVDFKWDADSPPLVSPRDQDFIPLQKFNTPWI